MTIDRALIPVPIDPPPGLQIPARKTQTDFSIPREILSSIVLSQQLSPEEKRERLVEFKERINTLPRTPAKLRFIKKLNSAIASLLQQETTVASQLSKEALVSKDDIESYIREIHHNLVLDSVTSIEGSKDYTFDGSILAYLRDALFEFMTEQNSIDSDQKTFLENLVIVMDHAIHTTLIQYDYMVAEKKTFESHLPLLRNHIMSRLKQIQNREMPHAPFMIVPAGSVAHAVAIVVRYDPIMQFTLTIVNTGEEAIAIDDDYCRDLQYTNLRLEDLQFLADLSLDYPENMEAFLNDLGKWLPDTVVKEKGRVHRMQRGESSCSYKSLTAALHTLMPEDLYWNYKQFYTAKLNGMIEDKSVKAVSKLILTKRALKSDYYIIDEKVKQIRTLLNDGEDPIQKLIDLCSYLKEIPMSHHMHESDILLWASLALNELKQRWQKISKMVENL